VHGDYPDWLEPSFARAFGDAAAEEGAALAERAPVDLRVNLLKTDPARAAKALEPLHAQPAGVLPAAFRIAAPDAADRAGSVETIPAFSKGWFEVQDLGSQIAAACAGDIKGAQALDYCAGGGGKTLAMAAAMHNKGQVHAYDADRKRLAPIIERLKRAGTRNVQVHDDAKGLSNLRNRCDKVLVDAPCTGTGTWRRRPDTKWRLTAKNLDERTAQQQDALKQASSFVRPGGDLIYVTCSVLPQENEEQVRRFAAENGDFKIESALPAWDSLFGKDSTRPRSSDGKTITLTPASTDTDGFFFCRLRRDG
jgi:16S rRNA (cytosine967-C5)-methyltransferase